MSGYLVEFVVFSLARAQEQSGKHVFLDFDWLDTYDAETKKTIKGYCALELSLDGNELFGHV